MENLDSKKEEFKNLTAAINTVLNKNDYKLSECQEFKNSINDFLKSVIATETSIKRNKYMVSLVGSVKAGKSTLLNALCRKRVCEAGAATETTKNCTIILNTTEDEKIVLFENKTNLEHIKENSIEILLNHILSPEEKLACDDFRSRTIPLNDDGLNKINSSENVVLAVIYINSEKDNILLQNIGNDEKYSIALIDLPGLDGLEAGISNHPVLKYICYKTNLCILIQSSVGALNKTTMETIKNTRNYFDAVDIYNVFNYFDATPWRNETAIKHKQDEIYEKHKSDLNKNKLGGYPKYKINAQMAWEACSPTDEFLKYKEDWQENYNEEKMLNESGIETLETALKDISQKTINESIVEAYKTKTKALKNHFEANENDEQNLYQLKTDLKTENHELETEKNDINRKIEYIYSKYMIDISGLLTQTQEAYKGAHDTAQENISKHVNTIIKKEKKYTGTEKNEIIDDLIKVISDGKYNINMDIVKEQINTEIKKNIDLINSEIEDKYKEENWFKNIIKYNFYKINLETYAEIKTQCDASVLETLKSSKSKAVTQVGFSRYTGSDLRNRINNKIEKMFLDMSLNSTWKNILNQICNNEMKLFKDHLNDELNKKLFTPIDNKIKLNNQMIEEINILEKETENLINAICH